MSSAVLLVINLVISLMVIGLLFAVMFKVLPDAKTAWRDVWVGAAVTALREAVLYVKSLPIYETLELRSAHSHTERTKKGLGQGATGR